MKRGIKFVYEKGEQGTMRGMGLYSVTQSDGNSFCGDVGWTASTWYTGRTTKYEKQIFWDHYHEYFKS